MEELELYLPKDICNYVVDPYLKEYAFLDELKNLIIEVNEKFSSEIYSPTYLYLLDRTEMYNSTIIVRNNHSADVYNSNLRQKMNAYWENQT